MQAMKKVRDEMGLTNVKLMIPFCRTVAEGRRVPRKRWPTTDCFEGENGLELYVMCEIPSNVISAEAFGEIFDGFSIGSNDLTQLTLGVDRDSESLPTSLMSEIRPLWLPSSRQSPQRRRRNARSAYAVKLRVTIPSSAQFLSSKASIASHSTPTRS